MKRGSPRAWVVYLVVIAAGCSGTPKDNGPKTAETSGPVDTGHSEEKLAPGDHETTAMQPDENGDVAQNSSIEPSEIRAVIKKAIPSIYICYEMALQKNPDLSGRIAPNFVIGPEGTVIEFQTNCDDCDPVLTECLENIFRSLQFPRPEGGGVVKVSYPINVDPAM